MEMCKGNFSLSAKRNHDGGQQRGCCVADAALALPVILI